MTSCVPLVAANRSKVTSGRHPLFGDGYAGRTEILSAKKRGDEMRSLPLTGRALYLCVSIYFLAANDSCEAQGAEAPDNVGTLEKVVIVGPRAALTRAQDIKRRADTHLEVVVSEDISKMPDKNVADSASRVAGVTTTSSSGTEGDFDERDRVSLRGLSPSLTLVTFDGSLISSGDWLVTSQTRSVSRSVSLTLFPSEMIDRLVVYKSSEARLLEGGIAGTVDLIPPSALSGAPGVSGALDVGVAINSLSHGTRPQAFAMVDLVDSNQNAGMLLQAYSQSRAVRRDGVEIFGYRTIKPGSTVAQANPELSGVRYPTSLSSTLFEQERVRRGGSVQVMFRPDPGVRYSLSLLRSELSAPNYNRSFAVNPNTMVLEGAGIAPDTGFSISNGVLTSARFAPVFGRSLGFYDMNYRPDERSTTQAAVMRTHVEFAETTDVDVQAGITTGHGKTPHQYFTEWNSGLGNGGGFTLNGIRRAPSFDLGSTDTSDPKSVDSLVAAFGDQNVDVTDREAWVGVDITKKILSKNITSIQYGFRVAHHTRTSKNIYVISINQTDAYVRANWPAEISNYPSNFARGLGTGFPKSPWYFQPTALARFIDSNRTTEPVENRRDYLAEFGVTEDSGAAYGQASFDFGRLKGNLGVRVVDTVDKISSYNPDNKLSPGDVVSDFGYFSSEFVRHRYLRVLPSLNLRLDVTNRVDVRFSAAMTMARPDYTALAGARELTPSSRPGESGTGTSGNPHLRAVSGRNVDVTIDWYPADKALISGSVYYIALPSFIDYRVVPTQLLDSATGGMVTYDVTQPVNVSARQYGSELSAQLPIWNNFGTTTALALTHGQAAGGTPILGSSRWSGNLSAWYDNGWASVRIGYAFRSSFYQGIDRGTAFSQASSGTVSASASLALSRWLSVQLDGVNLNNPILRYYGATESEPRAFYRNGVQYYVSLKAKL